MQTILGANGIIGEELAKSLRTNYTDQIRLVGRNPSKVHPDDQLFKADLLELNSVINALVNTEIAYLTVGLPYNSAIWQRDWIRIMHNVIEACKIHNCKLVYFDNTYAYDQGESIQKETSPFVSKGKKGISKKETAELLLSAMKDKEIEAMIVRAPEFYGPGKTKGLTNLLVFENIKKGKNPKLFLKDNVLRTLIYTPDASRATAILGNSSDCYGQTWHLPCDDNRMTYKEIVAEISSQLDRKIDYTILTTAVLKGLSLVNNNIKETKELFPRYTVDNIFDSSKFKGRFPNFKVTSYKDGIRIILEDMGIKD